MNAVIGDILPLALAVAISPIPIIATILMLMSPKPRPLGLSFLGGWVVGISVAVVAFTLLGGILPEPETGDSRPVMGTIQLIVGALLLLMAVKQWRGRPRAGEDAELPKWMAAWAEKAFYGTCDRYLSKNPDGSLQLDGICLVAGLGGKDHRDGSLAYYFSEPVVCNDAKGVGPLVLAYTEMIAR